MPNATAEQKKRSRTNWFMLLLNTAAALTLLLAYAAAAFGPNAMGYFALFGLAYPFSLLFNLLFIVYWYFKKRVYTLFSIAVILVGANHLTAFFQVSWKGSQKENHSLLKVLTYNVHVFDVFRNTRQRHLRVHAVAAQRTRHVVRQEVQRQSARVECVQACQLHAVVAAPCTVPCAEHAVYFDFFAYTVEYVALDAAVRRMEHHRHRLVVDTAQRHRRRRQIHAHAASGALVNIHERLDCNCFSRYFDIKHTPFQNMTAPLAVFCSRCVVYTILFLIWIITETSTKKIFKP